MQNFLVYEKIGLLWHVLSLILARLQLAFLVLLVRNGTRGDLKNVVYSLKTIYRCRIFPSGRIRQVVLTVAEWTASGAARLKRFWKFTDFSHHMCDLRDDWVYFAMQLWQWGLKIFLRPLCEWLVLKAGAFSIVLRVDLTDMWLLMIAKTPPRRNKPHHHRRHYPSHIVATPFKMAKNNRLRMARANIVLPPSREHAYYAYSQAWKKLAAAIIIHMLKSISYSDYHLPQVITSCYSCFSRQDSSKSFVTVTSSSCITVHHHHVCVAFLGSPRRREAPHDYHFLCIIYHLKFTITICNAYVPRQSVGRSSLIIFLSFVLQGAWSRHQGVAPGPRAHLLPQLHLTHSSPHLGPQFLPHRQVLVPPFMRRALAATSSECPCTVISHPGQQTHRLGG